MTDYASAVCAACIGAGGSVLLADQLQIQRLEVAHGRHALVSLKLVTKQPI
jgi:hypothetical protein